MKDIIIKLFNMEPSDIEYSGVAEPPNPMK